MDPLMCNMPHAQPAILQRLYEVRMSSCETTIVWQTITTAIQALCTLRTHAHTHWHCIQFQKYMYICMHVHGGSSTVSLPCWSRAHAVQLYVLICRVSVSFSVFLYNTYSYLSSRNYHCSCVEYAHSHCPVMSCNTSQVKWCSCDENAHAM